MKLATLTPEEDARWCEHFNREWNVLREPFATAFRLSWKFLVGEFPRLADFDGPDFGEGRVA